jgi:uncharacterized coiled-coil protein SlyX
MTEEQPPHVPTDRITALEVTMAHMRERMAELHAHNKLQDMEAEKQADRLGKEIEKLKETAWSFIKWLGGTLFAVLSSVILKTLGLV